MIGYLLRKNNLLIFHKLVQRIIDIWSKNLPSWTGVRGASPPVFVSWTAWALEHILRKCVPYFCCVSSTTLERYVLNKLLQEVCSTSVDMSSTGRHVKRFFQECGPRWLTCLQATWCALTRPVIHRTCIGMDVEHINWPLPHAALPLHSSKVQDRQHARNKIIA